MRTIKWIAVAGTVLLLAPATAQAGSWRGKTEQGRKVQLATGSAGKVKRLTIFYRASCRDGSSLRSANMLTIRRDGRTRGRFGSRGSYSFRIGAEKIGVRVLSRGRKLGRRWVGDFRIKARITRGGQFVTRCRVGKTGWSARRVG